jgi:hypothetical protein
MELRRQSCIRAVGNDHISLQYYVTLPALWRHACVVRREIALCEHRLAMPPRIKTNGNIAREPFPGLFDDVPTTVELRTRAQI